METNFKQQIETLMKGKNNFTIFLTKETQGKLVGTIQAGNFKSELEVMPQVDEITFNGTNVTYIRRYSDFPPSVSTFSLNVIKKVEETIPTPT